jgi:hypothetical protein
MDAEYLRCEASYRTWYNFNQLRFRKEVLYFLIFMSFRGGGGVPTPGSPHRSLPWTRWGPMRSPDHSPRSDPPSVKSWIRAWLVGSIKSFFLQYMWASICICIFLNFCQHRRQTPTPWIWLKTTSTNKCEYQVKSLCLTAWLHIYKYYSWKNPDFDNIVRN